MRHLVVAAAFENIDEADEIAVDIGMRVQQGVAHAGLGGKVDDLVEFLGGEQRLHAGTVTDIQFDEAEFRVFGQSLEAAFLEADVVIIVEIVEADDLVATRQQAQRGSHADKAGSAGNENFHGIAPCGKACILP